jgi:glycosyltransferase involved in cell wall biosynthesis
VPADLTSSLSGVTESICFVTEHKCLFIWDRDRMSASLGISPERFRVIPHAPYPILDTAPREAMGRRRHGSVRERSEVTVLFFGLIRPYKGLEHLIRAFDQLRRDLALPWKLLVVGETWEGWTLPPRAHREQPLPQ